MGRRVAPPQQLMIGELVDLFGKHRITPLGGRWECKCGEDYGPRTRSINGSAEARDAHDRHVARVLVAEGMTLGSADPREDFLRRATRRISDTPQA